MSNMSFENEIDYMRNLFHASKKVTAIVEERYAKNGYSNDRIVITNQELKGLGIDTKGCKIIIDFTDVKNHPSAYGVTYDPKTSQGRHSHVFLTRKWQDGHKCGQCYNTLQHEIIHAIDLGDTNILDIPNGSTKSIDELNIPQNDNRKWFNDIISKKTNKASMSDNDWELLYTLISRHIYNYGINEIRALLAQVQWSIDYYIYKHEGKDITKNDILNYLEKESDADMKSNIYRLLLEQKSQMYKWVNIDIKAPQHKRDIWNNIYALLMFLEAKHIEQNISAYSIPNFLPKGFNPNDIFGMNQDLFDSTKNKIYDYVNKTFNLFDKMTKEIIAETLNQRHSVPVII